MTITVKFRRGNTSTSNTLTLANGELYIDTSKRTVVVHDGSTLGGNPLATEANLTSGLATKATPEYVDVAVNNAVSSLVAAAPTALNTLNELATALGNNPNYATTITTALGTKQSTLVSGTNIKTINGSSILGSGNLPIIQFDLLSETNILAAIRDVITNTAFTLNDGAQFNSVMKKFQTDAGSIEVSQNQANATTFAFSNTTLPVTYEFWYYPTTSGRNEYIFTSLGSSGNSASITRANTTYITNVLGTSSSQSYDPGTLIITNQWNHVAIYLSQTSIKAWFNGTSAISQTFYVGPNGNSDDYRQSNPRTGIILGAPHYSFPQPQGYYGPICITSGDKYASANSITVPTSSFSTLNALRLIKNVAADRRLDITPGTKLNATSITGSSISIGSGSDGNGSIYAAGPISSSNSVTGTTFIGDGSQLTNVKSIPSVWSWSVDWQQSVTGSNYYPTATIQTSTFSKTLTPSKTGYMQITYYPKDIYCLQQIGHISLFFSVTSGGTEYTADYGFDNTTVGSNPHGPYRLTVPVTEASAITMCMKWMLQNPSTGGNYFNYGGNGTYSKIFAEYVTHVDGSFGSVF